VIASRALRFGPDPSTSVLDTGCRAHKLDNLYVIDTSFLPSIGAVNPALTAMANAIRVGETDPWRPPVPATPADNETRHFLAVLIVVTRNAGRRRTGG
jgi:hypothetical protein